MYQDTSSVYKRQVEGLSQIQIPQALAYCTTNPALTKHSHGMERIPLADSTLSSCVKRVMHVRLNLENVPCKPLSTPS